MRIPPGSMFERRPESLQQDIDAQFNDVVATDMNCVPENREGDAWGYTGIDPDYKFSVIEPFTLLTWLQSRNGVSSVGREHVVDIGACFGFTLEAVKTGANFENATAVGATRPSDVSGAVEYVVGNIENPEIYEEIKPADLIISRMTLMHTYDQLGIIEMMSNGLRPNGHLLVQIHAGSDRFFQSGLFKKVTEAAGVEMIGFSDDSHIYGWPGLFSVHLVRSGTNPILFNVNYSQSRGSLYDLGCI